MNVELIYERTCPNVKAARTRLLQAFHCVRLPATWSEWEVSQPETPEYARNYGSPTILVNGKDVSETAGQATSNSCRVYATGTGYETAPAVKQIANALRQATGGTATPYKSGSLSIAALPSLGVALLPKLTCPVCWPAYTALLSSAGISFVNYTPHLLPTLVMLLAITLWALAYRAPVRRGYGPFWVGLLASVTVVGGKFFLDSDPAILLGSGILVGASLWNIWPRKFKRPVNTVST